ncbi:MAG: transcription elongation factor GreA [Chloroflexi bacterium RBG_19FT_COMBO_50_10]|jgi:transcription elongation factor GreA|nr:MAG: transcription elongation factor GreA [Chloroflexi bacterium RBG_19FT_COMBO_50_10]
MEREIYLTSDGAAKLQAELDELKGPKRDEMAKRLRSAIQMGDLSENADYHKAKEDQSFMEGRIQELDHLLKNATIVDVTELSTDTIQVGSRVTVQEGDYPEETYFLVGAKEADPQNGKISNESPIGQALMGCRVGDEVTATTPGGEIKLKILKIE